MEEKSLEHVVTALTLPHHDGVVISNTVYTTICRVCMYKEHRSCVPLQNANGSPVYSGRTNSLTTCSEHTNSSSRGYEGIPHSDKSVYTPSHNHIISGAVVSWWHSLCNSEHSVITCHHPSQTFCLYSNTKLPCRMKHRAYFSTWYERTCTIATNW